VRFYIYGAILCLILFPLRSPAEEKFDAALISSMIEAGNIGSAREMLTARLDSHPDDFQAWRLLGRLYEVVGPTGKAASAYAQALQLRPEDIPSLQGLSRLLRSSPPNWLEEAALDRLPADLIRAEIAFPSHRERKTCAWRLLQIVPKGAVPEARDPRNGGSFPFSRYGYVLNDRTDRWEWKLTVRWRSEHHSQLARDVLDLLLRLYALTKEHLGREPMFGQEGRLAAWICPEGEAGGEQWKDNLYLYEADAPRPPLEWLREIAHEYGHHVLPAAGGFTEPEGWSGGFLGERLLVRWLLEASPKGNLWPGDPEVERYLKASVESPIRLFIREGPYSSLLRRTSGQAMDAYLGLVLMTEALYGSETLRDAFDAQTGSAPRRFLEALERVLNVRPPKSIVLPPDAALPGNNPGSKQERLIYRLYLPKGSYRLIAPTQSLAKVSGAIALNGRKPVPWKQPLAVSSGWHRLEIAIPPGIKGRGFILKR